MKLTIRLSTIIIGALLCMAQFYYVLPVPTKIAPVRMTPQTIEAELRQNQHDQKLHHDVAVVESMLSKYRCAKNTAKLIAEYSIAERLPVRLVASVVSVESSCRNDAMSSSRICIGLMQVNKHVWHYSTNKLLQPEENIKAGTAILAFYVHRYGLYNGVQHYFGVTDGSEASNLYADKVLKQAGIKS